MCDSAIVRLCKCRREEARALNTMDDMVLTSYNMGPARRGDCAEPEVIYLH